MKQKHSKVWKKSKNVAIVKQGASASIRQGGNAIAFNASDVGIVKVINRITNNNR